ncbi:hypothetical protein LUM42_19790 [Vibrio furnissii]|nr:hypothetical protein [Vibrio furnissii]UHJ63444.1 hypothetical protein LUM42_19790 [Vibrio furnissii]
MKTVCGRLVYTAFTP